MIVELCDVCKTNNASTKFKIKNRQKNVSMILGNICGLHMRKLRYVPIVQRSY